MKIVQSQELTVPGCLPCCLQDWVEAQKEFAGMAKERRNVWMQVQLDGTVRSSGTGTPPWDRFLGDLPTLDSVRTQMTDGIGPSI
jgi:hypothetical protein